MISEVLLDLYPFTGTEHIVEVYQNSPELKEASLKRGGSYTSLLLKDLDSIKDYDLIVSVMDATSLEIVTKFLKEKKGNSFNFILIAENKYNFHKVLNFLTTFNLMSKNKITLSQLNKSLSFINQPKVYQIFQSLENPTDIREIGTPHENYLLSNTSRVSGKRTLKGLINVFFELIAIRALQLPALAPAYVFIGENK